MPVELQPDRRLILSFQEVRALTQWPEAMVVDYQGILQDLLDVADQVDGSETGLQEQIDAANLEITNNRQWISTTAVAAEKAAAISAVQKRRADNLEQLIYAW